MGKRRGVNSNPAPGQFGKWVNLEWTATNQGPPYDHSKYTFHIKLLPDPDLPATGQAWEVRVVIQSHSSIRLTRGGFRWSAANIEPSPPNLPKPVDRQLSGHSHCWEWKLLEYPGKKAEECKWSASLFLFADTVDTLLEFRLEQLCRDNITIVWGGSTRWPDRWMPAYRRDDPERFNKHNWWFCPEYRMMKPTVLLHDDGGGNKEEENRGGGYLAANNKDEKIRDDDDDDLVSEIDHMVEGFVLL
ncbi:hypothetical protein V8F33_003965 [Rhypophila sp. PSN 637]